MTAPFVAAERVVTDLVSARRRAPRGPGDPVRGPMPSVSLGRIIEYAMNVVDKEGADALTVRRLAADLKISTRTLYKRIHNRDNLVRSIARLYMVRLDPPIRALTAWQETLMQWCLDLHRGLSAHPNLTALLTRADLASFKTRLDQLTDAPVQYGVPSQLADELCTTLAVVTLNDAIAAARDSPTSAATSPTAANLRTVLELILIGSIAQP